MRCSVQLTLNKCWHAVISKIIILFLSCLQLWVSMLQLRKKHLSYVLLAMSCGNSPGVVIPGDVVKTLVVSLLLLSNNIGRGQFYILHRIRTGLSILAALCKPIYGDPSQRSICQQNSAGRFSPKGGNPRPTYDRGWGWGSCGTACMSVESAVISSSIRSTVKPQPLFGIGPPKTL